jgi:hypothetical protein
VAETVLAKMAVEISANAAKFTTAVNQAQGQFKGLTTAVQSANKILSTFGVGFGALAIIQGLKSVVGIMSEFEATMSEVRAITGATGDEFQALERDALKLGAATKFTSQEVGQLQIAYGRLGFNTKEILDATEATLDLAAATGEDLAKSADVAGSTVRGFGLKANETQRVVDVMAKSFNTTALGLENFTEAMKFVAPIAAAANLSVEETTALLGTLADAGIRGSIAGTSLRKILTDLPRDSRPFQERLAELAAKGITVSDAFDEVGRTAQTSLLILAKNNDKTKELAASFADVAGEASKMARIMQDNLQGDVEKLTSAWEGLILSLSNTNAFRSATQGLTAFLNALSGTPDEEEGLRQLITAIKEESASATDAFIKNLQEIRRESGKPIDTAIVNELAEKYKLTDVQANKLFSSILEVNEALSFQETVIKNFENSAIVAKYGKTAEAVDLYKQKLYELILAKQIQIAQEKAADAAIGGTAFKQSIENAENAIASARRQIGIINEFSKDFISGQVAQVQAVQRTIINLKFYRDALKSIGDAFEQVELGARGFSAATSSNLRVLASESTAIDDLITSVERIKDSFKDFDFVIKPPDLSQLLNPITEITKTEGGLTFNLDQTLDDAMVDRFKARLAESAKASKVAGKEIEDAFKGIDLRGVITSALDGVAEALGAAIAGTQSIGKALLGVFGSILGQFGKMLIAAGVGILAAKKAFQSLNGYVAIAAGVALVALGAVVSGSIKSLGSNIGSGGSGSSGGSSPRSESFTKDISGQQIILVGGEFRMRGNDLVAVIDKTNKSKQRSG